MKIFAILFLMKEQSSERKPKVFCRATGCKPSQEFLFLEIMWVDFKLSSSWQLIQVHRKFTFKTNHTHARG